MRDASNRDRAGPHAGGLDGLCAVAGYGDLRAWLTDVTATAGALFSVLVIAMLFAGFTEILLPEGFVERWLSDSSDWRGLGLARLAGIITPDGSIIELPLIAVLYKSGVGISVLMTYATSLATLSIMRVPLEVGFYGWRLSGVRVAVSLVPPLIAGMLTQLLLPVLKR